MVCEAWRFPVVDSHYDGVSVESSYAYNDVTFVYDGAGLPTESVEVVGSFGDLFAPVPRAQCDSSVRTPASTRDAESAQGAGAHLQVRGRRALPARSGEPAAIGCRQRTTLVAVFHRCLPGATGAEPPGARGARQVGHTPASVPPGREPAVYPGGLHKLDRAGRGEEFPLGYRLDEEVGTVNYIDKVLARPPSSTTPTIITPACRSSMACCGLAPAARTHCSCRSRTTPSSTARWPPIRSRRASLFMFGGTTEQQEPLDDGAGQSAAAGRDVGPDGDELRGLLVRCAYGGSVTLSLLDGAPGGAIIER